MTHGVASSVTRVKLRLQVGGSRKADVVAAVPGAARSDQQVDRRRKDDR